jgi:hypothetical protein
LIGEHLDHSQAEVGWSEPQVEVTRQTFSIVLGRVAGRRPMQSTGPERSRLTPTHA